MLTIRDAHARVIAAFDSLPSETVSVTEAAGRVLAVAPAARLTQPPADLFPLVLAKAQDGDSTAIEILTDAGEQLAQLAVSVCASLFGQATEAVGVALVGGVFRHSDLVRHEFSERFAKLFPQAKVRSGVIEPVDGALWMARRLRSGDHLAGRDVAGRDSAGGDPK